jgi:glycosylphosphatidylinositol transamidase (GPIT) subunit GPI8
MKAILIVLAAASLAAALHPSAMHHVASLSREARATSTWAILVAGSNTYGNYRHQSDICQAYQTLRKLEVPEKHIIVMMYDDIAMSSQNPQKGKIFNSPDHVDVYAGVPKDYTGKTVTSANFLKVIQGQEVSGGSGKKLQSTKDDHVFIFFDDHGGAGILGFPNDYLYKEDLEKGLNSMSSLGLYGELVFHVEACEAGSMFYDVQLPAKAYIHTASPITESSYGWMWDDQVNAYLSDVWSWYTAHYMEDNRANTMQQLFDYDYTTMGNWSIPCQYGDKAVASSKISSWFTSNGFSTGLKRRVPKDAVKSYNVSFNAALRMHAKYNSEETAAALKVEQTAHNKIDALAAYLKTFGTAEIENKDPCTNMDKRVMSCAMSLSRVLHESCGRNEYLGLIDELLFPLCNQQTSAMRVTKLSRAIRGHCSALML